jgi:hypothetical protein
VRKPKLESDEVKLRELLFYCRGGNFREVRALVAHYPYLLSLSDRYGLSALHHADLSGDSSFVSRVLQLYRNPRAFSLKVVTYESEEAFLSDRDRGLMVRTVTDELLEETAVVSCVGKNTLASAAGVMTEDYLDAVYGKLMPVGQRIDLPRADDVLDALVASDLNLIGFPLRLEFRGPAFVEILGRDGWTPCHAAAAQCGRQHRKILQHLLDAESQATAARDAKGCTPQHWSHIRPSATGKQKRPLSAGPCCSGRLAGRSGRSVVSPQIKQQGTTLTPALQPTKLLEELWGPEDVWGPGPSASLAEAPALSRPLSAAVRR